MPACGTSLASPTCCSDCSRSACSSPWRWSSCSPSEPGRSSTSSAECVPGCRPGTPHPGLRAARGVRRRRLDGRAGGYQAAVCVDPHQCDRADRSSRPRRRFVPWLGAKGAAIAAVLGEAVLALAALVMLVRARPALLPRFGFALRLAAGASARTRLRSNPGAAALRAGRPRRRRLLGRGLCGWRRPGRGSGCLSAQAARVNSALQARALRSSRVACRRGIEQCWGDERDRRAGRCCRAHQ